MDEQERMALCRKRIEDHIERVKYFYRKMVFEGFIPRAEVRMGDVKFHDDDKLQTENLRKQALRMKNPADMTTRDMNLIDMEVARHVTMQPHHPEHWGGGDHRDEHLDCSQMPATYIYEMIADWMATSEERGNDAMEWYNKTVNKRWMFTDAQCELIKRGLAFCKKYVDRFKKRTYGGVTYVNPLEMRK